MILLKTSDAFHLKFYMRYEHTPRYCHTLKSICILLNSRIDKKNFLILLMPSFSLFGVNVFFIYFLMHHYGYISCFYGTSFYFTNCNMSRLGLMRKKCDTLQNISYHDFLEKFQKVWKTSVFYFNFYFEVYWEHASAHFLNYAINLCNKWNPNR